ncbi:bifunctional folylpolyglutamate synthase/dihydrofolate synthase [Brevundimonas sp.]|uniref:bifunctional folylpolyglutamate synthase/dihydrofolate synthase n=1 Tax=Brevundimonas sp. TaxID=1871086 RepID=UPI003D15233E
MTKFGAGIGLGRVLRIARAMGVDPADFSARTCVITGSNGKGSTAAMTQAILTAHGFSTALFTSPHLRRINERFRLGFEDIPDDDLDRHWAKVEGACADYQLKRPDDLVGGFEFLFLVALSWIAETSPDFLVIEAGIGGRYDPVRLFRSQTTALVSLDLEHTRLLGDTLAAIGFDKMDACAVGGEVVVGPMAETLLDELRLYADLSGRTLTAVRPESQWTSDRGPTDRLRLAIPTPSGPVEAHPALAGDVQVANAVISIHLGQRLLGGAFRPDLAAAGLETTRWPGRLEIIRRSPLTVMDIGHSPAAVRSAKKGLYSAWPPDRFDVLICGASRDKDWDPMIRHLAPGFAEIVCTRARHNGMSAEDIAAVTRDANPDAVVTVRDLPAEAWAEAERRTQPDRGIYIAGGLFLAIEVCAAVTGEVIADPFF